MLKFFEQKTKLNQIISIFQNLKSKFIELEEIYSNTLQSEKRSPNIINSIENINKNTRQVQRILSNILQMHYNNEDLYEVNKNVLNPLNNAILPRFIKDNTVIEEKIEILDRIIIFLTNYKAK